MQLGYSWLGKDLAVDFANTMIVVRPGEELDGLETQKDLACWLELERDRLGPPPRAGLREFRRLRDAIRALMTAAVDGDALPARAVSTVNQASKSAPWFAQLRDGAAVDESRARTRADEILGAIAASAIELLGGPDRELIRMCRAPSCGLYFVADSERRQWCTPSCGNRARVARHYARRTRLATPGGSI